MLEYHHPEPFPPEGTFIARIASVLQVSAPAMRWHRATATVLGLLTQLGSTSMPDFVFDQFLTPVPQARIV